MTDPNSEPAPIFDPELNDPLLGLPSEGSSLRIKDEEGLVRFARYVGHGDFCACILCHKEIDDSSERIELFDIVGNLDQEPDVFHVVCFDDNRSTFGLAEKVPPKATTDVQLRNKQAEVRRSDRHKREASERREILTRSIGQRAFTDGEHIWMSPIPKRAKRPS